MMPIETKTFSFEIATNKEPEIELMQLISKCIESYGDIPAHDIGLVLKYFNDCYSS